MKVVGVGIAPKLITLEAIEAIRGARAVYGSRRALELAYEFIVGEAYEIGDYQQLHTLPEDAVILSTGDPMFSGLGHLGDEVVCGISSMQLACARLGIRHEDVAMCTVHGRDPEPYKERILSELSLNKTLLMLPDKQFGPVKIAQFVEEHGFTRDIAVCEDLGYPYERIRISTTKNPPTTSNPLTVVVLGQGLGRRHPRA
ncbi:MAG: cobalt-precorrin-7 (C(5))-methyltransferase [Methermicoccaceae archaeon]